ncbi:MAG: hypothetical protein V7668_20445 [Cereibacter changlensis]
MLIEQTTAPVAALPVQALKDHLRLGTGFADDGLQDGLMESYLRAALAAIEGRIGKALIARRFQLVLERWRSESGQALPVAPVFTVLSVTLVDAEGAAQVVPASGWRLAPDMHRPRLLPVGTLLPAVPSGGRVEVVFEAGFGAAWGAVPSDLAQAVLLLAAEYYEHRSDGGMRSAGLPFAVVTLIERWRTVRVLGGGQA